jgi:hypothetical protein
MGPFSFGSSGADKADAASANGTTLGHELRNAPGRLGKTKGWNVASD